VCQASDHVRYFHFLKVTNILCFGVFCALGGVLAEFCDLFSHAGDAELADDCLLCCFGDCSSCGFVPVEFAEDGGEAGFVAVAEKIAIFFVGDDFPDSSGVGADGCAAEVHCFKEGVGEPFIGGGHDEQVACLERGVGVLEEAGEADPVLYAELVGEFFEGCSVGTFSHDDEAGVSFGVLMQEPGEGADEEVEPFVDGEATEGCKGEGEWLFLLCDCFLSISVVSRPL